jgi:trehalose-6-phosphatase
LRIAVDFDNTLAKVDNFPIIKSPNLNLINLMITLKNEGHYITLWTCREGQFLNDAVSFCKKHGLIFDSINETSYSYSDVCGKRKVIADVYIDDRAISPEEALTFFK